MVYGSVCNVGVSEKSGIACIAGRVYGVAWVRECMTQYALFWHHPTLPPPSSILPPPSSLLPSSARPL